MDPIPSPPSRMPPDIPTPAHESSPSEFGGPPTDLPPAPPSALRSGVTTAGGVALRTVQGKPIETGFSALWRGVVQLATKIPWLNTTHAVRSAARNIRLMDTARDLQVVSRANRFDAFVQGLQSTYGEAATDAAVRLTHLSPSDFLSASKMHQAHAVAAARVAMQGTRAHPK